MHGKRSAWKTVAIAVLILGVGAYFAHDWLRSRANTLIHALLEKHQIHADYDSGHFSFRRGLECQDLVLHSTSEHNDPVFSLSQLTLKFKLGELIRGRFSGAHITTGDAVFVAHHLENPLEIRGLNLDMKASPQQLSLYACRGLVAGVEAEVSGDLSLARAVGAAAKPKKAIADFDVTPIAKVVAIVAMTSTGPPPVLNLALNRLGEGPFEAKGSLKGKALTWRGVTFDTAEVVFETTPDPGGAIKPGSVQFSSVDLTRGGASLTGAAAYRLGTRTVVIDHLETGFNPWTLAAVITSKPVTAPGWLGFAEPPRLTASGSYPLGASEKATFSGTFAASAIHIATPKGSGLAFSGVASSLAFADGALRLPDLEAATMGGKVAAPSEVKLFAKPLHFNTDLKLEGASLKELVEAVGASQKHANPGSLFATFKGGGEPSLAGIDGGGEARLSSGDLVSVPVLSPLAPLFSKIVTVFVGGTSGTDIFGNYQLDGGIFTSNDIRVRKSAFEVAATAKLDFPTRQLHATAAVGTGGISRIVTAPIGKLLELEAMGSFDHYTWRFKNLPGLEDIAEIDKLIGGVADRGLRDADKAATGAVETGAKDAGEAAKDVGEDVKKVLGDFEKLVPREK